MEKSVVSSGISFIVGDSHRYKTKKGIISCVHPCFGTFDTYEIYCIEGDLFDDIERYETLEEAEGRIKNLLQVKSFIKNLKN
jgi:hypothetical protein